jgi:hypothetical protein
VEAAFTAEEEDILDDYFLCKDMYCPFLTAQWKAPGSGENLKYAQNQAARDGVAIVNYLYELYQTAYQRPPAALETCHFSLECDLVDGELWVHWREGDAHYMELLEDFSLRKENTVREVRGYLRNIVEYARGPRLESIKKALPLFMKNRNG